MADYTRIYEDETMTGTSTDPRVVYRMPDGSLVNQDSINNPAGQVYRDEQGVYRGEGPAQAPVQYYSQPRPKEAPGGGKTWGVPTDPTPQAQPQNQVQAPMQQFGQRMGGGSTGGVSYGGERSVGINPLALKRAPYSPPAQPEELWNQLKGLLRDPSSIERDPGYQFRFGQGMQALNRTAAAQRMRFAGKTMLDAEKFGQGFASNEYGQRVNQLASGAQDELSRWGAGVDLYNKDYANRLSAASEEQRIRDAMQIPGANVYGEFPNQVREEAPPDPWGGIIQRSQQGSYNGPHFVMDRRLGR